MNETWRTLLAFEADVAAICSDTIGELTARAVAGHGRTLGFYCTTDAPSVFSVLSENCVRTTWWTETTKTATIFWVTLHAVYHIVTRKHSWRLWEHTVSWSNTVYFIALHGAHKIKGKIQCRDKRYGQCCIHSFIHSFTAIWWHKNNTGEYNSS